jgi:hypothetical protein
MVGQVEGDCPTSGRKVVGEQMKIFFGALLRMGNTGVTQTHVVERGTLRRDEAREN